MMDIYLEQEQLLMLILKQELELMQEQKLKMEKYDPWNVHGCMNIYSHTPHTHTTHHTHQLIQ